jgi:hypothetical protein
VALKGSTTFETPRADVAPHEFLTWPLSQRRVCFLACRHSRPEDGEHEFWHQLAGSKQPTSPWPCFLWLRQIRCFYAGRCSRPSCRVHFAEDSAIGQNCSQTPSSDDEPGSVYGRRLPQTCLLQTPPVLHRYTSSTASKGGIALRAVAESGSDPPPRHFRRSCSSWDFFMFPE